MSLVSEVLNKFESKPSAKDTYLKIKDMNLLALKGYARSIKLPSDVQSRLRNTEDAINEIMGFLYDDDWMKELMNSGVL